MAYFLEVFTFLTFAMLLSLLIKKSGFVIVLVFMYTLIFEPFLTVNMIHNPLIKEHAAWLAPYFPIRALNNLIHVPFQRYVFMEIQNYIAWKDVLIVLGWLVVFQLSIYTLLDRRDI
jgi:ABC-type transport system involved in multi-copper enzyme maturation permease subunit